MNKKRNWLKLVSSIVLLLLFSTGVYGYLVYHSFTETVATMHVPIDRVKSEKRAVQVTLTKKEAFSVLMLGVDERKGDRGRSDTIVVLTVNPSLNTVKLLSIPRDTRTTLVGKGKEDKINHAYAFGGVEMSIESVENFLDIPIDYYVQMNMQGFKDIVDAFGGVTVENDLDFTHEGVHYAKGVIELNGEKALGYSRMRYEDPRGDFGRQSRQRQIIQAVLKEGASLASLTNYDQILSAIGKNVKTNLTFSEMVDIQKNYKEAVMNMEQLSITGEGKKINGIYYLLIPEDEKQRIQTDLKSHLELN